MENYILKLVSGTEYKLYKGTTLVSDANLTTLFGTAGEMYLSFDFNSGTPSSLTTFTITNSSDNAVITNTNVTVAEGKNYKATWSNSATTFDTFEELEGKALDEAQLSFLMGKIKDAKEIETVEFSNNITAWNLFGGMDAENKIFLAKNTANDTRRIYFNSSLSGSYIDFQPKASKFFLISRRRADSVRFFAFDATSGYFIYGEYAEGSSASTTPSIKRLDCATENTLTSSETTRALSANQGRILNNRIGDLTTLTTTAKTSAVVAINEVNGKAVGTSETLTIATTDWTALSSSDPYDYSATVTATTTISATSTVELINDQAVLFGTYGFAIGSVDTTTNTVTIYSIGQPSASVSLTIKVRS